MTRNRVHYLLFIISTILIGLAARQFSGYLPDMINLGLGDTLWALMMYWIIGFVFPKHSVLKIAVVSLSICFLVELSQLYQADWINTIRSNRIGKLILGQGFLWSDFLAYSVGVELGVIVEKYILKHK